MKFIAKVIASWFLFKVMDILIFRAYLRVGNLYMKQKDANPDTVERFKAWKKRHGL